ncbi:hypothetical protein BD408DRAFT_415365 [Parasitella parasitica]|nr:hypothetical protein BD408DRAFT_415365 [Parasitella parasitica]
MGRILSSILTVFFISSSFVQAQRGLFPRAVSSSIEICFGNDWQFDVTTRFTGIFFGDFYTGDGTDILGGLAVEGNFHAPDYVVNANHGANCSAVDSLNSYGLVVGGITTTTNTQVHGSAYLSMGGTVNEVKELEGGCIVTDELGTGIFDFKQVKEMAIVSNADFAHFTPTAILNPDGTITYTRGDELTLYEIFGFHSCAGQICSQYTSLESDPSAIFFGEGNWNGVQGSTIDPLKTYVMNIPVLDGDTIVIDSNNPSLGFNPCKLIYNFYPVDAFGNYLPEGEFTLIRRTANQFGGFTLAPRGHIVDGSVGNFAGNIVGLDYTWENLNAGVEIHDYHAAGGDCDYYEGCIPVHVDEPSISITIPTYTFSSTSYSPSDSVITWSRPSIDISTYDSCTADITDTETVTTTDTDTVTVTIASSIDTITQTVGTVTETESITETDVVTKTLIVIKPTTIIRTYTSCGQATETVTETVVEQVTTDCDYHTHHHDDSHKGHHHGPDEECDEDDDQDDNYKQAKKDGKDDEDEEDEEDEKDYK